MCTESSCTSDIGTCSVADYMHAAMCILLLLNLIFTQAQQYILYIHYSDAPIWNLANIPITNNGSEISAIPIADPIYNFVQFLFLFST